jgi:hypothetical protein
VVGVLAHHADIRQHAIVARIAHAIILGARRHHLGALACCPLALPHQNGNAGAQEQSQNSTRYRYWHDPGRLLVGGGRRNRGRAYLNTGARGALTAAGSVSEKALALVSVLVLVLMSQVTLAKALAQA